MSGDIKIGALCCPYSRRGVGAWGCDVMGGLGFAEARCCGGDRHALTQGPSLLLLLLLLLWDLQGRACTAPRCHRPCRTVELHRLTTDTGAADQSPTSSLHTQQCRPLDR